MWREIMVGAKSFWHAWRMTCREHMWPFLIVPGLIAALYFPIVIILTYFYGHDVAVYVRDHWLPGFLKGKAFVILITIALWMLGLYLGFVLFRNLVMVLYSPVLSYLSRKTEEKAVAMIIAAEPAGMVKGMVRGITMSLTSFGLAVLCFFLCLVLLIIPVIGQLGLAVLLPVSQMFLAGHGFVDPTLERRGFTVRQSFSFVKRHRYRVLGCGAVFVLLAMIPLVGWFFAPTLGIVAGTLVTLDTLESGRNAQKIVEV